MLFHAAGSFFKSPWCLASSSPSTSQPCVPGKPLYVDFIENEVFNGHCKLTWAVPPLRPQHKAHVTLDCSCPHICLFW